MSSACNLCGKPATQRCKSCQHVVYCCREHQKLDWKTHKLACQEIGALKKQGQDWESDVQQGTTPTGGLYWFCIIHVQRIKLKLTSKDYGTGMHDRMILGDARPYENPNPYLA